MSELRYNPLLDTFTIVASNRQNRPNMPIGFCPFCPSENNEKVPKKYDVFLYPNDFPALSNNAPKPDIKSNNLYEVLPSIGQCEVILYSPEHNIKLANLSNEHILKLVQLWVERNNILSKIKTHKFVFIFENRGAEVGVTMPHPHGQIYAYSFVPQKIKVELENCKKHYQTNQKNMFDTIIQLEKDYKKRIIFETETFLVFLPFFTDYPYGIFVVSKKNRLFISDFSIDEQQELGIVLKKINGLFDTLFDREFPYMMCMHQGIINTENEENQSQYYRFHIEFYPPLRTENTIKYYASSESGAWAATNTKAVEDTAIELRNALKKHQFKTNN